MWEEFIVYERLFFVLFDLMYWMWGVYVYDGRVWKDMVGEVGDDDDDVWGYMFEVVFMRVLVFDFWVWIDVFVVVWYLR